MTSPLFVLAPQPAPQQSTPPREGYATRHRTVSASSSSSSSASPQKPITATGTTAVVGTPDTELLLSPDMEEKLTFSETSYTTTTSSHSRPHHCHSPPATRTLFPEDDYQPDDDEDDDDEEDHGHDGDGFDAAPIPPVIPLPEVFPQQRRLRSRHSSSEGGSHSKRLSYSSTAFSSSEDERDNRRHSGKRRASSSSHAEDHNNDLSNSWRSSTRSSRRGSAILPPHQRRRRTLLQSRVALTPTERLYQALVRWTQSRFFLWFWMVMGMTSVAITVLTEQSMVQWKEIATLKHPDRVAILFRQDGDEEEEDDNNNNSEDPWAPFPEERPARPLVPSAGLRGQLLQQEMLLLPTTPQHPAASKGGKTSAIKTTPSTTTAMRIARKINANAKHRKRMEGVHGAVKLPAGKLLTLADPLLADSSSTLSYIPMEIRIVDGVAVPAKRLSSMKKATFPDQDPRWYVLSTTALRTLTHGEVQHTSAEHASAPMAPPRVVTLPIGGTGVLYRSVATHRDVEQYPADFTDNTQLYGVLDSSDERVNTMERRVPLASDECVPMQEWQTTFHPSCNVIHEMDLASMGEEHSDYFQLFGTKGFWRHAWRVDSQSGHVASAEPDTVVLKTLKIEHRFEEAHYEHDRVEAVAMERLTASPHVINIFGYCGHSVITEFADGKRLGDLADKLRTQPLGRLRIARNIASGLADVHGIDGDGNATLVHLDINPANVVSVKGTLKLNDFNIGILRRWNTTSNQPCGFPAQYPNPQWRSPEEARNEQHLTEKVDVFSLGHILYRLICGHEPWHKLEPGGRPPKDVITQKVANGILPYIPPSVVSSTDPEVVAIREAMMKCYTFDPEERPSARSIADMLETSLDSMER